MMLAEGWKGTGSEGIVFTETRSSLSFGSVWVCLTRYLMMLAEGWRGTESEGIVFTDTSSSFSSSLFNLQLLPQRYWCRSKFKEEDCTGSKTKHRALSPAQGPVGLH